MTKVQDSLTRQAAAALTTAQQTAQVEREISTADGLVGYDLGSSEACCHGGGACPPDCDCGAGCACRAATPDESRVNTGSQGQTVSDGVDDAQADDTGGVSSTRPYPENVAKPQSGSGAGSADSAQIDAEDHDDAQSGGGEFGEQTGERGGEGNVPAPVTSDDHLDGEQRTTESDDLEAAATETEADETETEDAGAGDTGEEPEESRASASTSRAPMTREQMQARDNAVASAENGMEAEGGHTHGQHDHPHANSYEVVHDHSHDHTHQDGTSHGHPHMHAHAHHDHDGTDMAHGHPHSHSHDHSHEYRMSAPDMSTLQEPTMDEWRARKAEEERVRQATLAASIAATPVTTPSSSSPASITPPVAEPSPMEEEQRQQATAAEVQVPTTPRGGARISSTTRAGLHSAIMNVASTCNCDACRDAQSCYDPDHDGDDDSTPAGDTDHDAAGNSQRVQMPSSQMTRRAQRLQIAQTTRAVLETELSRFLAPYLQRFDAVAARLATIEAPTAHAETPSAIEERMTGMASELNTLRSSLEEAKTLLTQIASAPMPGGPVLQAQSGAVTRYLPTDPRAMQRTQAASVAEAVATLQDAGILKPDLLGQTAQIDAATAMITAGLGAGK